MDRSTSWFRRGRGAPHMSLRFGATHAPDLTANDVVAELKKLTDGRGVDVAIEALGRQETFEAASATQIQQCPNAWRRAPRHAVMPVNRTSNLLQTTAQASLRGMTGFSVG